MSGPTTTSSAADLRTWLTGRVAEYLEVEVDKVDVDVSFESQGLDSMSALALCDEIEDKLGLTVEPTLAWDFPSITKLAEHLSTTLADQES